MIKRSKKSKKLKNAIIVIVVIAVIASALFVARKVKNASAANNKTYKVHSEVYKNVIEIAGNINAAQEQALYAASDGSIIDVFVQEGDTVKKGDVILQKDDTSEQYNLAKHNYDVAVREARGEVSPRERAILEKQREVYVQKVKDKQIIARFDGVIAELTAKAGDYYEATEKLGTLVDRDYLKAKVEVVETDAPKLKAGQKVNFTFPSYKKKKIEGYVVSFPAVGKLTTRGATVVDVEVRIDEPEPEILPNYSFTGEIEISPSETVLLVEREAIGYENGSAFAERIMPDGKKERVDVQVEPYGSSYVKILYGLKDGDELAAEQKDLASGSRANRPGGNRNAGPMPGGAAPMMPR